MSTDVCWYEVGRVTVSVALLPPRSKEDIETCDDAYQALRSGLEDWYQRVLLRHFEAYCERA